MDSGLIAGFILDGKGGGKKIGWEEIDQWKPKDGLLWVHLNYTNKAARKWLRNKSDIEKHTVNAMLQDDTRPRTLNSGDTLSVFLRGVNTNPGQDPEDMVSIRTYLSESRIITTRRRHLLSVDDLCHAIATGNGPKTPAEFLEMLNDRLTDRISTVLDNIDEQVDLLEEEVVTAESRLLRPRIADIRRQTISIKRYLAPQKEALGKLVHETTKLLTPENKNHFREATDRVTRYIEDLDAKRERTAITQEELSSRIAEQLDSRMYVLSLVAIIFLPMTFITGLLGINVGGIPGSENPMGFIIVTTLMIILGIGTLLLLKKRKWM